MKWTLVTTANLDPLPPQPPYPSPLARCKTHCTHLSSILNHHLLLPTDGGLSPEAERRFWALRRAISSELGVLGMDEPRGAGIAEDGDDSLLGGVTSSAGSSNTSS